MNRKTLIGVIAGSAGLADMLAEVTGRNDSGVGRKGIFARSATSWIEASEGSHIRSEADGDRGYCLVLGAPHRQGSSASDCLSPREILHGYLAKGAEVLQEISGGFAIIVHDAQKRRTLVAVDRFGIYPIVYRLLDNAVIVGRYADEVAKLLPKGDALDIQALYDYLYFHVIPAPTTVYKSVKRLEAAQCAEFTDGRLDVRSYWSPDYRVVEGTFESRRKAFTELMKGAVARESGGGTTGAYLSGGTDSSTVVGWLGQVTGKPAKCFSIGFDAAGYDEMAYARLAAKHFSADHLEYYVTPVDVVRGVPTIAAHYDQPFGNSSALPAFFCAGKAAERGVSVLLAGDGGDEIFGGNVRYATQKLFGFYDRIPSALRSGLLEPFFLNGPFRGFGPARKVRRYIEQAKLGLPARLETYNLLRYLGASRILTAEILHSVRGDSPERQQRDVYARFADESVVNSLLAFDWKYTLAEADLPKVVQTAEMAGCEVRFPMLADDLVAFANGLPESCKVKGLKLRHFFKEASRGFLPDEILTKSKHGFGLPFGTWVVSDPTLRRFALDSMQSLVDRRFIRREFLDEVVSDRLSEHAGFFGEAIWILLMLEQWLRVHDASFTL
ncbi:MAG: asparagine synthase-related protein [Burkholderiales bacterium]